MKAVTAHASGERHGVRACGPAGPALRRARTSGSHSRAASSAGAAHTTSAVRQPPATVSATGTDTPDAMLPTTCMRTT